MTGEEDRKLFSADGQFDAGGMLTSRTAGEVEGTMTSRDSEARGWGKYTSLFVSLHLVSLNIRMDHALDF
ncbi:hypothetical protein A1F94_005594 [Pyrenophora tritici-repentis]|nr:hypothetical protein A1F94_005594 [Pyrenophora tritici-repentis]